MYGLACFFNIFKMLFLFFFFDNEYIHFSDFRTFALCNHLETDTREFLHVEDIQKHKCNQHLIIKTVETNVLVLVGHCFVRWIWGTYGFNSEVVKIEYICLCIKFAMSMEPNNVKDLLFYRLQKKKCLVSMTELWLCNLIVR